MTNERQIEHLGVRPSWDCVACGNPWPCEDAKERLLKEFHGQPSGLAIYLSAQLNDAFEDLTRRTPYPPPDLYDRFLSWIHPADADPAEAGTHTDGTATPAGADPSIPPPAGGDQPPTGNAGSPHQGPRHNGPHTAKPEGHRKSLDL